MNAYRIYVVRPDGRLQLGAAFQVRDDACAVTQARLLTPSGRPAELWEGGRFVGAISEDGDFSRG